MKANLNKILALTILSISMISCSPSQSNGEVESMQNGSTSEKISVEPGTILESYESKNHLHKYDVLQGKTVISEYKILIPEHSNDDNQMLNAATELQYFVNASSGVNLDIVKDNNYQAGNHYISIGNTKALDASKIDLSKVKELGTSGLIIKSDEKNVYLIGGEPFGITYTVYEFLKHEISLVTYGNNEYSFDHISPLYVHDFDLFEKPDIDLRIGGYGVVQNNSILRNRMKFNTSDEGGKIWMGPNNVNYHNTFDYLPPDTHKAAHPKWYADSGEQVCFTAHGDKQEAQAMFDEFMRVFLRVVDTHPECTTISITQQDIPVWCECSECTKLKTKYGTDAASIIIFANKVSDALKLHFEQQKIDRNVDILLFAYHKTTDAPAKKDLSGKWVPIDEEVTCRDNVCCFYAPIAAEFNDSFYDEKNISFDNITQKWKACSKKMYIWIYGTNFRNYLIPMNNFNSLDRNYQYFYENGAAYMYDQGQWNQTNPTGWSMLKIYLQSLLQWNTELDVNEAINDWFEHWFKQASKPMKDLFDAWNTYTRNVYKNKEDSIGIFVDKPNTTIFPKGQIDYYLSCLEKAYDCIEILLEEDEGLYSRIHDRILLESIAYRYIDYTLYKSYYSSNERDAMWKQFKADVAKLGISMLAETQNISELFE